VRLKYPGIWTARRLAPSECMPWVEGLRRAGHEEHVAYEACGFGFMLYRQLIGAGAHCQVFAPRKLDEQCTRVKSDPRDATTLCQRLSRYLEGGTSPVSASNWYIIARSSKPRGASS
jgi:transposase